MRLVIVESPTKAKTLGKFLGKEYRVEASFGHVLDLPKKELGVDVENDFNPTYITNQKSEKIIAKLNKEAKDVEEIILATDPDREGEAISWHLAEVLKSARKTNKKNKSPKEPKADIKPSVLNLKRVVFHEITPEAVKEAFSHPRELDNNLFNAQQARRILDRLVGYKLSPLLWRKIRYGLSAGRVQSAALRLVVDRENAREAFSPMEYWTIEVELTKRTGELGLLAGLAEFNGKKIEIKDKKEADILKVELASLLYTVKSVEKQERRREPPPPYTTSTLQQSAVNNFGFTGIRTMRAAQGLYEKGLITYHRTDSVNLAASAITELRETIKSRFGVAYLPSTPKTYKTKSRLAQEAHEAIRPTRPSIDRSGVLEPLDDDEGKLYDLIWKRAVACQMTPSITESTTVAITADKYLLKARGSRIVFDGFSLVTGVREEEEKLVLPNLEANERLQYRSIKADQHFTEPPARFTEASLIKELEENGIGRPSTYAPILSTLLDRGYVSKEGRALFPRDLGKVVTNLLVNNFEEIVDLNFTASLEEDLDLVADGKKEWVPLIRKFYEPFEKKLIEKEKTLKKADFTVLGEISEKCPECEKPLVKKLGKFGTFISCSGFPDCKYGKALNELDIKKDGGTVVEKEPDVDLSQLEGKCPVDEGDLIIKVGRFGRFISCINYPKCKFTKKYLEKVGMKCPECKTGEVISLIGKYPGRSFYGCGRYPECKWVSSKDPRPKSANAEGEENTETTGLEESGKGDKSPSGKA